MPVRAEPLREVAARIFEAVGSAPAEAAKVAARLVEANLCGHDSHGVIRVPQYVTYVQTGKLVPNQAAELVREVGAVAMMDGGWGFGQIVAEQAMEVAIAKAQEFGIGMVTLRHASHVGRLADWAIMATDAGQAAIVMANGVGHRLLVAPFGARDARGSTNPIAIAMPVAGGPPVVLDFATSAIAEGKVRVASHKGVPVPEECLIDAGGQPTRDPDVLYEEPYGALLPFGGAIGGHKGGGLWVMCDLLAGALSGGRCAYPIDPENPHFSNNLIMIAIAPAIFAEPDGLGAEVQRYLAFIKSARPRAAGGEVLLPGEPERISRAQRLASGIPLADRTVEEITAAAVAAGLPAGEVEALLAH